MKIDILSDLHFDFWQKPNKKKVQGQLRRELDGLLDKDPEVEVLIVAGDLGHYNNQAFVLLQDIAKEFNYKKIFCVLGNHDYYLISKTQEHNYQKSSKNREKDWYDYKDENGIVQILNGEIVEYQGVKFGGAMGWYDGSYMLEPNMYGRSVVQEWKDTMTDARLIMGMGDFYDMSLRELPKFERILDADVIITHFCPLSERIAFQEKYQYQSASKFYCFDGEKYLKKTNAKFLIYGHSHGHHEFTVHGTRCIMNALGYPMEFPGYKKTQITMEK